MPQFTYVVPKDSGGPSQTTGYSMGKTKVRRRADYLFEHIADMFSGIERVYQATKQKCCGKLEGAQICSPNSLVIYSHRFSEPSEGWPIRKKGC